MKKTKIIIKKVDKVEDVICNKCGESLKNIITMPSFRDKECSFEYGLRDISYIGGFFSRYFEDGEEVRFDICEKCLKEFVDSFKISPDYS